MLTTKAQATKERILQTAAECFLLSGYHATGLDKIIKVAKITKGNFYYHFKSKEILAVETLDWQFKHIYNDIQDQVLSKQKSPLDTLFLLFDLMANRQKKQHQEGQICGCYFGNFTLELSAESLLIREKVKSIFQQYAELIENLLNQAIKKKEISLTLDTAIMSHVILGQIEGAILLDKANQQPQQVEQSLGFIKHYLLDSKK